RAARDRRPQTPKAADHQAIPACPETKGRRDTCRLPCFKDLLRGQIGMCVLKGDGESRLPCNGRRPSPEGRRQPSHRRRRCRSAAQGGAPFCIQRASSLPDRDQSARGIMRSSLQWMLRDGEDRTGSLPKPHGEAGRETGAVALEFAIVAPLFFMLLIAILVYGIYFTVWIGVTGAAQEGARASVAGLSPAERKALAVNTVNKILDDMPIVARDHATVIADAVQG